jgi:molecular chaperone DnaK
MGRKILGLGQDGKLVLRLPGGKTETIPERILARALLLIDCSSSMSGPKLAQAIGGAIAFSEDAVHKNYSVGLITFASDANLICHPEASFSELVSGVERLAASGSTNMTDAIEKATAEFVRHPGVKAMVIVTDGVPDNPETALTAAKQAKESGIDIIVIGTADADQGFLQKIATRSDLAVKVSSDNLQSGIAWAVKMLPGADKSRC